MEKRIELHDSSIESTEFELKNLIIKFDSLVVLNVTDDFGLKFDKTEFFTGQFKIDNAKYEKLPENDYIYSGFLKVGAAQYNLIPVSFESKKPVFLSIKQGDASYRIFGDGFSLKLFSQD